MIKINKKLKITAFALVFGVVFSPAIKSLASDITAFNIIKLVNNARNINGLASLNESSKLNKVASDKLEDMVDKKYFAHTSPEGKTPWSWFLKNKYDYEYAGENLAIDFMTAEKQHEAWMKSETHKKNILSSNFTEIGVAVGAGKIDDHISIITVQVFGKPAGSGVPANREENFTSAFNPFADKSGMVLASKEMKLEKADSIKVELDDDKKTLAYLKNKTEGNWWADFALKTSWIILILFVVINPLIMTAGSFKIKEEAGKMMNKVGEYKKYSDQNQFR